MHHAVVNHQYICRRVWIYVDSKKWGRESILTATSFLGGMTEQRFNDFHTQARLNLDPNEHVIFVYEGAPAHNNPTTPGPNSELEKLPSYSPFLNIVERALKAAIKVDISRPEQRQDGKESR